MVWVVLGGIMGEGDVACGDEGGMNVEGGEGGAFGQDVVWQLLVCGNDDWCCACVSRGLWPGLGVS